jgi:hypothetical protein
LGRDGTAALVRLASAAQMQDLGPVDQAQGHTRQAMPLHLFAHERIDPSNIRCGSMRCGGHGQAGRPTRLERHQRNHDQKRHGPGPRDDAGPR